MHKLTSLHLPWLLKEERIKKDKLKLFLKFLWSDPGAFVAYYLVRNSMSGHMRLEHSNYFFRCLTNKLVDLKKIWVIVSSDKVVLSLELKEINSKDLQWSWWYWVWDHWLPLLPSVVCIADLTLGDIFFNLFVHTRPVESFPCSSLACLYSQMTGV